MINIVSLQWIYNVKHVISVNYEVKCSCSENYVAQTFNLRDNVIISRQASYFKLNLASVLGSYLSNDQKIFLACDSEPPLIQMAIKKQALKI